MAGQVWLVLALCSMAGVAPCLATADANVVYNPDGSFRLQRISVPGQSLQGRLSWQTPDLSQVWIQYPVNQQGRVPWTPAQFTYSVVSDPVKRVVPVVPTFQPVTSNPQTFSFDERTKPSENQEPSSRSERRFDSRVPAVIQSLPNENEYDYEYEYEYEDTPENQPIDGENTGPVMDKFPGPEEQDVVIPQMEKFPGPVMDKLPRPVEEDVVLPQMDKFPGPVMDKFPGPVKDTFTVPEIDERIIPGMDKFSGPEEDEFPDTTLGPAIVTTTELPIQTTTTVRNRFTLPFTTTTSRSVQFTEARVTPFPTRFRPTTQSRPMMNKFPGPAESRRTPIPRRFTPTPERTVMNKFPGPMMNKFTGPEEAMVAPTTEKLVTESSLDIFTLDEEIISATEPAFDYNVNSELDNGNNIKANEQIEDTTELGPIVRFTSRGRPRVINKPAQKTRFETRKQSSTQKPIQSTRQNQNRRPVPQLIVDPSLRQATNSVNTGRPFRFRRPGTINQPRRPENNQLDQTLINTDTSLTQSNTEQSSINENTRNRFRLRRPGIGLRRARPGIRRRPVSDNDIDIPSTDITLPREESSRSLVDDEIGSGRGVARSRPRVFRFRNVRPQ